jgi:hypothetical protein
MKLTLRPLLAVLVFLNSFQLSAQLSLKSPLICHNKENELKYYDDGNFKLNFQHAKFSSFTTYDSTVRFFEDYRYLEVKNTKNTNEPIKIQLIGNSISFTHTGKTIVIDSIKTTSISVDDIFFSFYKNGVNYTVAFYINEKAVYLDINIIGHPKNIWTWDLITIKQDSSSFNLGYNPFYDKGPSLISRQDQSLHFGLSISHSFKTNKYVWRIAPVFYEETDKAHVINILSDFYYEYNRKGKLKPKKCIGEIKYCDSE